MFRINIYLPAVLLLVLHHGDLEGALLSVAGLVRGLNKSGVRMLHQTSALSHLVVDDVFPEAELLPWQSPGRHLNYLHVVGELWFPPVNFLRGLNNVVSVMLSSEQRAVSLTLPAFRKTDFD